MRWFKTLFPLFIPALLLAQPNSGLEGRDVIINATEAVEVCSGTGPISLAVGCTGGGTTYKHTFGTDGSVSLPGTLTVTGEIVLSNNVAVSSATTGGVSTDLIKLDSVNDIVVGDTTSFDDLFLRSRDDTNFYYGTGQTNWLAADAGNSTVEIKPTGTTVATFSGNGFDVGTKLRLRQDAPFLTGANIQAINAPLAIGTTGSAQNVSFYVNSANVATFSSTGLALNMADVTATGSAQGDAAGITTAFANVLGATGTNGVRLPGATTGAMHFIINASANTLLLYPDTGDDIYDGATNNTRSVAAQAMVICFARNTTSWRCSEAPKI